MKKYFTRVHFFGVLGLLLMLLFSSCNTDTEEATLPKEGTQTSRSASKTDLTGEPSVPNDTLPVIRIKRNNSDDLWYGLDDLMETLDWLMYEVNRIANDDRLQVNESSILYNPRDLDWLNGLYFSVQTYHYRVFVQPKGNSSPDIPTPDQERMYTQMLYNIRNVLNALEGISDYTGTRLSRKNYNAVEVSAAPNVNSVDVQPETESELLSERIENVLVRLNLYVRSFPNLSMYYETIERYPHFANFTNMLFRMQMDMQTAMRSVMDDKVDKEDKEDKKDEQVIVNPEAAQNGFDPNEFLQRFKEGDLMRVIRLLQIQYKKYYEKYSKEELNREDLFLTRTMTYLYNAFGSFDPNVFYPSRDYALTFSNDETLEPSAPLRRYNNFEYYPLFDHAPQSELPDLQRRLPFLTAEMHNRILFRLFGYMYRLYQQMLATGIFDAEEDSDVPLNLRYKLRDKNHKKDDDNAGAGGAVGGKDPSPDDSHHAIMPIPPHMKRSYKCLSMDVQILPSIRSLRNLIRDHVSGGHGLELNLASTQKEAFVKHLNEVIDNLSKYSSSYKTSQTYKTYKGLFDELRKAFFYVMMYKPEFSDESNQSNLLEVYNGVVLDALTILRSFLDNAPSPEDLSESKNVPTDASFYDKYLCSGDRDLPLDTIMAEEPEEQLKHIKELYIEYSERLEKELEALGGDLQVPIEFDNFSNLRSRSLVRPVKTEQGGLKLYYSGSIQRPSLSMKNDAGTTFTLVSQDQASGITGINIPFEITKEESNSDVASPIFLVSWSGTGSRSYARVSLDGKDMATGYFVPKTLAYNNKKVSIFALPSGTARGEFKIESSSTARHSIHIESIELLTGSEWEDMLRAFGEKQAIVDFSHFRSSGAAAVTNYVEVPDLRFQEPRYHGPVVTKHQSAFMLEASKIMIPIVGEKELPVIFQVVWEGDGKGQQEITITGKSLKNQGIRSAGGHAWSDPRTGSFLESTGGNAWNDPRTALFFIGGDELYPRYHGNQFEIYNRKESIVAVKSVEMWIMNTQKYRANIRNAEAMPVFDTHDKISFKNVLDVVEFDNFSNLRSRSLVRPVKTEQGGLKLYYSGSIQLPSLSVKNEAGTTFTIVPKDQPSGITAINIPFEITKEESNSDVASPIFLVSWSGTGSRSYARVSLDGKDMATGYFVPESLDYGNKVSIFALPSGTARGEFKIEHSTGTGHSIHIESIELLTGSEWEKMLLAFGEKQAIVDFSHASETVVTNYQKAPNLRFQTPTYNDHVYMQYGSAYMYDRNGQNGEIVIPIIGEKEFPVIFQVVWAGFSGSRQKVTVSGKLLENQSIRNVRGHAWGNPRTGLFFIGGDELNSPIKGNEFRITGIGNQKFFVRSVEMLIMNTQKYRANIRNAEAMPVFDTHEKISFKNVLDVVEFDDFSNLSSRSLIRTKTEQGRLKLYYSGSIQRPFLSIKNKVDETLTIVSQDQPSGITAINIPFEITKEESNSDVASPIFLVSWSGTGSRSYARVSLDGKDMATGYFVPESLDYGNKVSIFALPSGTARGEFKIEHSTGTGHSIHIESIELLTGSEWDKMLRAFGEKQAIVDFSHASGAIVTNYNKAPDLRFQTPTYNDHVYMQYGSAYMYDQNGQNGEIVIPIIGEKELPIIFQVVWAGFSGSRQKVTVSGKLLENQSIRNVRGHAWDNPRTGLFFIGGDELNSPIKGNEFRITGTGNRKFFVRSVEMLIMNTQKYRANIRNAEAMPVSDASGSAH